MSGLTAALRVAHEVADLADAITLPAFRRHTRTTAGTKADGSWVTDADVSCERAVRSALHEAFPDHAVLGEEDGLDGDPEAPCWVIDPIDGTSSYVRGTPVWATLIGLRVDGEDVLGVVSAPALGRRWDGLVGVGAHRDGEVIRVAPTAELGDAEVSFGGLDWFVRAGRFGLVEALCERAGRVRGYGDFWHHCLVAEGAIEVAVEAVVSPWDLVAVRAVVEAAGGRSTSLDGVATSDGGDIVSTNGSLHDEVLGLIAQRTSGPSR